MRKFLPLLLVLLVATTAFAQNKGRIIGTVTTPDGAVIQGVTVTISSDALIARSMNTMTNERGMFRFVLLPVGDYALKLEKQGYKTIEQTGLNLGFDATLSLNKTMAAADFEEVITITGEAPVVDKTSSSIGDKLDTAYLQNMPNTRNVWALPNLTAGFSDNSSFGAVQDAGQAYNTDGVNVSDPATKTIFSSINIEAVEQMDVAQFGANAEYGAFTGASLNVVTKSGGNEFSGEANYYAQRIDWVDDNNGDYPSVATPTKVDLDSIGLALGGPVIQDQVWFFANYNYEKRNTLYEIIDGTITRTEDPARPFIKVTARWDDRNITQGSWIGYTQYRSHRNYVGSFSANYEDSLWEQNSNSDTYLLQHSFVVNDDIILEARYAGFRGGFDLTPRMADGTNKPLMYDQVLARHLPGSSANRQDIYTRNRDDALITMNYFNDDLSGSHSMKFGFEYERSLGKRFFSLTDYELFRNGVSYVKYDYGSYTGGTVIKRYAGYGQDSWSVTDKLTINAGFRLDSTGTYAETPATAPIGSDVIYKFNDPAPRIGFAYDIMGDGKTVLRGFYGRYYEGVVSGNTESFTTTTPPQKTYYGQYLLGSSAPLWTLWSVSGGSGNFLVDSEMDNQYSEGFTVSVEREVMENLAASATFIWRKDHNILGEVDVNATWDTATANFSNANGSYSGVYYPGYNSGAVTMLKTVKKGDVGVPVEPNRTYMGMLFEVNKRLSDNYSLKASYTYSKSEGNLGQGYGVIQGFNSFSNPNGWVNSGGRLSLDRPHQFKLSGTYIAPFDIFISPAVTYYSGTPYTPSVTIGDASVSIEKTSGERRFDNQFNIDMRLEKAFVFENRYRIGLILDIFNVFNDDAVTGFSSTNITSSSYLRPNGLVSSRFYQVGARFIF